MDHAGHPVDPLVPLPQDVHLSAPATRPERHVVAGWGGAWRGQARVWRPAAGDDVPALLAHLAASGRRICLRGAGQSYGDASVHADGDVLCLQRLRGVRLVDEAEGLVEVGAGATIEDLWRTCLPHGWWPPVVPGTMRPTLGGCLAANVHGKNHFRVGGIVEHVASIDLALPDGSLRTLAAGDDDELFRAVIGGFGLLGLITAARLRMKRVRSGLLDVEAVPVRALEDMHDAFESLEAEADYLVGWIDCFHRDRRGLVHAARHLAAGDDPDSKATLAGTAQDLPPRILGVLPRSHAWRGMQPFAHPGGMSFVNAVKHFLARRRGRHTFRQSHVAFSFLLDYVPGWKRVYHPGGLIQYQSFVPRERALEVHARQMQLCEERGIVSWLGVYKRHRPCTTLMAHAVDGYSLALDFPVTAENRTRLWDLCHEMDELVLAAGGRFYFAKDLTATPAALERAYPGLERFRELKRELDPDGVLTSDLAKRLGV